MIEAESKAMISLQSDQDHATEKAEEEIVTKESSPAKVQVTEPSETPSILGESQGASSEGVGANVDQFNNAQEITDISAEQPASEMPIGDETGVEKATLREVTDFTAIESGKLVDEVEALASSQKESVDPQPIKQTAGGKSDVENLPDLSIVEAVETPRIDEPTDATKLQELPLVNHVEERSSEVTRETADTDNKAALNNKESQDTEPQAFMTSNSLEETIPSPPQPSRPLHPHVTIAEPEKPLRFYRQPKGKKSRTSSSSSSLQPERPKIQVITIKDGKSAHPRSKGKKIPKGRVLEKAVKAAEVPLTEADEGAAENLVGNEVKGVLPRAHSPPPLSPSSMNDAAVMQTEKQTVDDVKETQQADEMIAGDPTILSEQKSTLETKEVVSAVGEHQENKNPQAESQSEYSESSSSSSALAEMAEPSGEQEVQPVSSPTVNADITEEDTSAPTESIANSSSKQSAKETEAVPEGETCVSDASTSTSTDLPVPKANEQDTTAKTIEAEEAQDPMTIEDSLITAPKLENLQKGVVQGSGVEYSGDDIEAISMCPEDGRNGVDKIVFPEAPMPPGVYVSDEKEDGVFETAMDSPESEETKDSKPECIKIEDMGCRELPAEEQASSSKDHESMRDGSTSNQEGLVCDEEASKSTITHSPEEQDSTESDEPLLVANGNPMLHEEISKKPLLADEEFANRTDEASLSTGVQQPLSDVPGVSMDELVDTKHTGDETFETQDQKNDNVGEEVAEAVLEDKSHDPDNQDDPKQEEESCVSAVVIADDELKVAVEGTAVETTDGASKEIDPKLSSDNTTDAGVEEVGDGESAHQIGSKVEAVIERVLEATIEAMPILDQEMETDDKTPSAAFDGKEEPHDDTPAPVDEGEDLSLPGNSNTTAEMPEKEATAMLSKVIQEDKSSPETLVIPPDDSNPHLPSENREVVTGDVEEQPSPAHKSRETPISAESAPSETTAPQEATIKTDAPHEMTDSTPTTTTNMPTSPSRSKDKAKPKRHSHTSRHGIKDLKKDPSNPPSTTPKTLRRVSVSTDAPLKSSHHPSHSSTKTRSSRQASEAVAEQKAIRRHAAELAAREKEIRHKEERAKRRTELEERERSLREREEALAKQEAERLAREEVERDRRRAERREKRKREEERLQQETLARRRAEELEREERRKRREKRERDDRERRHDEFESRDGAHKSDASHRVGMPLPVSQPRVRRYTAEDLVKERHAGKDPEELDRKRKESSESLSKPEWRGKRQHDHQHPSRRDSKKQETKPQTFFGSLKKALTRL
jgi:hypothetical protein